MAGVLEFVGRASVWTLFLCSLSPCFSALLKPFPQHLGAAGLETPYNETLCSSQRWLLETFFSSGFGLLFSTVVEEIINKFYLGLKYNTMVGACLVCMRPWIEYQALLKTICYIYSIISNRNICLFSPAPSWSSIVSGFGW